MPLILNETTLQGATLLIWHLTETEDQLLSGRQINISARHPLRRRQKAVYHHLQKILWPDEKRDIRYDELGKPWPPGPGSISISHSKNFVSMIWHPDKLTGIDIEEPDDRIFRIAQRFVNSTEIKWLGKSPDRNILYLIWGIKECIFKVKGGNGVHYHDHIHAGKPETDDNYGSGNVNYRKNGQDESYRYFFRHLEDYLLVYTIA